jgi:hypothetical protein
MNDYDRIEIALDVIESAEVIQEFEDSVWLKLSKEDWQAIQSALYGSEVTA